MMHPVQLDMMITLHPLMLMLKNQFLVEDMNQIYHTIIVIKTVQMLTVMAEHFQEEHRQHGDGTKIHLLTAVAVMLSHQQMVYMLITLQMVMLI
jgi:NADH:ubiquinone oxidoreductase subunit 2 (subunit N)